MFKTIVFMVFCFTIQQLSYAEIHIINSMQDIVAYLNDIDPQTSLIIFDVDNTLIAPVGELATDQWFLAMAQRKKEQYGISNYEAEQMIVPLYINIRYVMETQIVELDTSRIICELQEKKIPVIALTACRLYLEERTLEQLKQKGIDFSFSSPLQKEVLHQKQLLWKHKNGMICTCGNSKGRVLLQFLFLIDKKVNTIYMIDDKRKNLECVEQALKSNDQMRTVKFVGFEYRHLFDKKLHVDFDKANAELDLLVANGLIEKKAAKMLLS